MSNGVATFPLRLSPANENRRVPYGDIPPVPERSRSPRSITMGLAVGDLPVFIGCSPSGRQLARGEDWPRPDWERVERVTTIRSDTHNGDGHPRRAIRFTRTS